MLAAYDDMLEGIHLGRRQALICATSVMRKVLRAENCSCFRVCGEKHNILELEAHANESWTSKPDHALRLDMLEQHSGSLTCYLARKGRPVCLRGKEIMSCLGEAQTGLDHLINGRRYAILFYPIRDERGSLTGVIKCENKIGPSGKVAKTGVFNSIDFKMFKLLSERAILVGRIADSSENMDFLPVAGDLLHSIQMSSECINPLQTIIEKAVSILHVDRGDFVWWNTNKNELIYAAHVGLGKYSKIDESQRVRDESFVRYVFDASNPSYRIAYDLRDPLERKNTPYFELDAKVRSELAVRVDLDGNPVGVLNVESYKRNAFSDREAKILQSIAGHAALAIQMLRSEELMRKALEHKHGDALGAILTPILESIIESCGCEEGLLFQAEETSGTLRLVAWKKSDKVAVDAEKFTQSINGTSFAAWVFNRMGHPSQPPWVCRHPKIDPIVNKDTLALWEIESPLLGYPLTLNEHSLGCIVLWTRRRPFPPYVRSSRIEHFAHLASMKIALWQSERASEEAALQYRSLAENSPLMVITKKIERVCETDNLPSEVKSRGFKFVFTYVNRAFLDYAGLENVEAIREKTDWDLFASKAAEYYRDDCAVIEGSPITKREDNIRPTDGRLRHVQVWKNAIVDIAGKVTGVQVVCFDETEHRELEQSTEKAVKLQELLLKDNSMLLHDLRHRVKGGLQYVDSILRLEQDRASCAEFMHIIHDVRLRVQNMELMLNLLYNIRSGDSVGMCTFMSRIVKTVVESYRPCQTDTVITYDISNIVSVRFPQRVAMCCGMIITELVANAMEHAFVGRKTGIIRVMLREIANDSFEIIVQDDGVGMPSSDDLSMEQSLGLHLVKCLVEQQLQGCFDHQPMSGVGVTSGTEFFAKFSPNRPLVEIECPKVGQRRGGRSVLIVEDDAISAMTYRSILEQAEYEVFGPICTRAAAVQMALELNPSAVLMDVALGDDMDAGFVAAREIRKSSMTPIVFLTQRERDEILEKAILEVDAKSVLKTANLDDNLLLQPRHRWRVPRFEAPYNASRPAGARLAVQKFRLFKSSEQGYFLNKGTQTRPRMSVPGVIPIPTPGFWLLLGTTMLLQICHDVA